MQLRTYQQAAVDAAWDFLRTKEGNPVISLPTGSGKSLVIAELARVAVQEWDGRVLCLTHVWELIEQNAQKLHTLCPWLDIGIYSASGGRKDSENPVVFAQIQSCHRKPELFGRRDLVIVDECHLINAGNDQTMYASFLAGCKTVTEHCRVIGLTATPFRMSGPITGPDGLFADVCYQADLTELIDQGFLSPIVSKSSGKAIQADLSSVGKTGGEYVLAQLGQAMSRGDLVPRTVEDVITRTSERKSVIVFASTIEHGLLVKQELEANGQSVGFISGDTPGLERQWIVDEFRKGGLKFLVNVNCLSTGFDHPGIDCVVSLRPTESAGLWLQQVGRGFRLAPGKTDCLLLDYSGNLQKFGPINLIKPKQKGTGSGGKGIAPTKECSACQNKCHLSFTVCPVCGEEFPIEEREHHHDTQPDQVNEPIQKLIETIPVGRVSYSLHNSKKSGIPILRVQYFRDEEPEPNQWGERPHQFPIVSEWICLEHEGFARQKAEQWWKKRSHFPVPLTVLEAVELAPDVLAPPLSVTIRRKDKDAWPEVLKVELGPRPMEPFLKYLEQEISKGDAWEPEGVTGATAAGGGDFLDDMPF